MLETCTKHTAASVGRVLRVLTRIGESGLRLIDSEEE
jgi:hypothetical protein